MLNSNSKLKTQYLDLSNEKIMKETIEAENKIIEEENAGLAYLKEQKFFIKIFQYDDEKNAFHLSKISEKFLSLLLKTNECIVYSTKTGSYGAFLNNQNEIEYFKIVYKCDFEREMPNVYYAENLNALEKQISQHKLAFAPSSTIKIIQKSLENSLIKQLIENDYLHYSNTTAKRILERPETPVGTCFFRFSYSDLNKRLLVIHVKLENSKGDIRQIFLTGFSENPNNKDISQLPEEGIIVLKGCNDLQELEKQIKAIPLFKLKEHSISLLRSPERKQPHTIAPKTPSPIKKLPEPLTSSYISPFQKDLQSILENIEKEYIFCDYKIILHPIVIKDEEEITKIIEKKYGEEGKKQNGHFFFQLLENGNWQITYAPPYTARDGNQCVASNIPLDDVNIIKNTIATRLKVLFWDKVLFESIHRVADLNLKREQITIYPQPIYNEKSQLQLFVSRTTYANIIYMEFSDLNQPGNLMYYDRKKDKHNLLSDQLKNISSPTLSSYANEITRIAVNKFANSSLKKPDSTFSSNNADNRTSPEQKQKRAGIIASLLKKI